MSRRHTRLVQQDGKVLVVTDEAGGGITETRCNQGASGKIGAAHFWKVEGAPRKLGSWLYPNPLLTVDPLATQLATIGRTERACTIHVFRNGGNGSAGPGAIQAGFDGVSRLPAGEFVTAHYGVEGKPQQGRIRGWHDRECATVVDHRNPGYAKGLNPVSMAAWMARCASQAMP